MVTGVCEISFSFLKSDAVWASKRKNATGKKMKHAWCGGDISLIGGYLGFCS